MGRRGMRSILRGGATAILSTALCFGSAGGAAAVVPDSGEHVLPLNELRQNAQTATEQREKNINDIERVLSYPAATEALAKSNVNQDQMKRAVATLDDQELARLADRARASEKDVQGGLIVGILALIGLIVVIIIVVALVA
jgi:hypothetical protein